MRNIVSMFLVFLCAFVIVAVMPAVVLTDDNSVFAVIRGPTFDAAQLIATQDHETTTATNFNRAALVANRTNNTQKQAALAAGTDNFGKSPYAAPCLNQSNPAWRTGLGTAEICLFHNSSEMTGTTAQGATNLSNNSGTNVEDTSTTAANGLELPAVFAAGRSVPVIAQNYPNPFNRSDAPPLTAA